MLFIFSPYVTMSYTLFVPVCLLMSVGMREQGRVTVPAGDVFDVDRSCGYWWSILCHSPIVASDISIIIIF